MRLWEHRRIVITVLLIIAFIVVASQLEYKFRGDTLAIDYGGGQGDGNQKEAELPPDHAFRQIAETNQLRLKVDEATGHFIVEDKRNGNVWRSFPDPQDWENETIGGAWRRHLVSPLMFQYIDFTLYNSPARESSFVVLGGTIENVTEIEGGIQWTYDMPEMGFAIPVQIRIQDDYVETKIIDSGIEEGRYSLLWLRLFPFLAAEHSRGQDGYMFIPDGSGALIRFDEHRLEVNRGYQESIFGRDMSFQSMSRYSSRYPIHMPVFGMKSGDKAMLAVVEEGAEYGDIYAAPSGLLSQYNWITAQQTYRSTFEQITNRNKGTGFITYNKDDRFGTDRTVRYYMLDTNQADYVGMATRYRQYLMEEKGLTRLTDVKEHIPLQLTLLGADTMAGMLNDRYVKATTTEEAGWILTDLRERGVEEMSVTYIGWQKDGYSAYGGYFSVDERLGGNKGMREFIELAHSLDVPVLLGVNYELNSTGANGFKQQYHAIRDMAGTIQETWTRRDAIPLASMSFILDAIKKDLARFERLQVDGLYMMRTGSRLASDYNTRVGSTRTEAAALQRNILQTVSNAFERVEVGSINFYAIDAVNHIHRLPNDYSYDLFSEKAIPFAQIALHGLITYTSSEENERQQWTHDFLKDIEYGALPSFIFTHAETEKLKEVYGLQLKNSQYADWADIAVSEYHRYNEALAHVQDQFIVDHRELAEGVRATVYEDGTMIIVNYTDRAYRHEEVEIGAQQYAVLEGADGR